MSLSHEVLFVILEETEKVENLFKISTVCNQFRKTCKDKTLWKRIFNKRDLVMFKKSKSVRSWIFNFRNSLTSKRIIDKYMKRINKVTNLKDVMRPVSLNSVGNASMIHIPELTCEDELEGFIQQDRVFSTDTTLDKFRGSSGFFLELSKVAGEYHMSIVTGTLPHEERTNYIQYKLNKEQVYLFLCKLAYYYLFTESFSLPSQERRFDNMEKDVFVSHGYNTIYWRCHNTASPGLNNF